MVESTDEEGCGFLMCVRVQRHKIGMRTGLLKIGRNISFQGPSHAGSVC